MVDSRTADVAVVGAGMIGAAAARHLAEAGLATLLVGSSEPPSYAGWQGPFASHWDEGRITRIAARDRTWAIIARRSIDRYADIEERSGVQFHEACGVAIAAANAEEWAEHSRACGGDARVVEAAAFERDTGIHVPSGNPVVIEGAPSGHINPRRLVAAQITLAKQAGAGVIERVVDRVEGSAGSFVVGSGREVWRARSVILATGAFGANLVGRQFKLIRRPRTILLAELGDRGHLPSLLMDDIPDPRLEEIYWVPPVIYPDGRSYLKIGGELDSVPGVDPETVNQWFRDGGSEDEIDALRGTLLELLPGVDVKSWSSRPCVITDTPTGHPYLGWADDGIVVALGGNGSAAKSSDELGRLAAGLIINGGWLDPDLAASEFQPVLA